MINRTGPNTDPLELHWSQNPKMSDWIQPASQNMVFWVGTGKWHPNVTNFPLLLSTLWVNFTLPNYEWICILTFILTSISYMILTQSSAKIYQYFTILCIIFHLCLFWLEFYTDTKLRCYFGTLDPTVTCRCCRKSRIKLRRQPWMP